MNVKYHWVLGWLLIIMLAGCGNGGRGGEQAARPDRSELGRRGEQAARPDRSELDRAASKPDPSQSDRRLSDSDVAVKRPNLKANKSDIATQAATKLKQNLPNQQWPPQSLPDTLANSSAEAQTKIVAFAETHLGMTVSAKYAGQLSGNGFTLPPTMPAELPVPQIDDSVLAFTRYYAILDMGLAVLAFGDCLEGASCLSSGELPVEIVLPISAGSQVSSIDNLVVGIFALQAASPMPTNAGQAQQIVTSVYPNLANFKLTEVANANVPGYTFSATEMNIARDTLPTKADVENVAAGVLELNGQPVAYAVVTLATIEF